MRAAQIQLGARGTSLAVDGVSGAATAAATRGFQRSKGLAVDGIVGPDVWRALIGGRARRPRAAPDARPGPGAYATGPGPARLLTPD